MPERDAFPSLDAALHVWGKVGGRDQEHVRAIVDLIARQLGPVARVYVGQQGNVVGASFGRRTTVGVYVSPEKVDVAPDIVAALGGLAVLAALYPGFVAGPGQRAAYARFWLSNSQDKRQAQRFSPVGTGTCCFMAQPLGAECLGCGRIVE